jgi:hypothetical protein
MCCYSWVSRLEPFALAPVDAPRASIPWKSPHRAAKNYLVQCTSSRYDDAVKSAYEIIRGTNTLSVRGRTILDGGSVAMQFFRSTAEP